MSDDETRHVMQVLESTSAANHRGASHQTTDAPAREHHEHGIRRCAHACDGRYANGLHEPHEPIQRAIPEHDTSTMGPISILLVEDDAPTRQHLHDALAADPGFTVESVGSLADARAAIARTLPRVLLTDLELPDGHGTDLTAEVHAAHPAVEILVISVLCDEANVVAAIAAGASGYIVKDALPEDIGNMVRQVLEGQSPLSAGIARYLLRRLQAAPASRPERVPKDAVHLTGREIDILWGIAKGLSYHEIADNLGISRTTVPNHIKSIYRKLEVNSRGEAVYEAVSRQLITL